MYRDSEEKNILRLPQNEVKIWQKQRKQNSLLRRNSWSDLSSPFFFPPFSSFLLPRRRKRSSHHTFVMLRAIINTSNFPRCVTHLEPVMTANPARNIPSTTQCQHQCLSTTGKILTGPCSSSLPQRSHSMQLKHKQSMTSSPKKVEKSF